MERIGKSIVHVQEYFAHARAYPPHPKIPVATSPRIMREAAWCLVAVGRRTLSRNLFAGNYIRLCRHYGVRAVSPKTQNHV